MKIIASLLFFLREKNDRDLKKKKEKRNNFKNEEQGATLERTKNNGKIMERYT